jgi:hypothetical protein
METTYTISIEHDKNGNPVTGYILKSVGGGQQQWLADMEFSPFDAWWEAVAWVRRSMSVDMDRRFT